MTLVIAGHDIQNNGIFSPLAGLAEGLFVMADSTINDGMQTLLSGFKKIYTLPIQVYQPYFVGATFKGYQTLKRTTNCFIGFAGSTLTAQHILNGIGNHLREMRYAYEYSESLCKGNYKVLMHCEPNLLHNPTTTWANDMFLDEDMVDLLSGEVVAKTVHHVLTNSLNNAKQYKIDEKGWDALLTQYVLGTYCEVDKLHKLFTFKPRFKREDGELGKPGKIVGIEVDQVEVRPGELAVLGMTKFEAEAQAAYQVACAAGADVKKSMFEFLNCAIDLVQADDGFTIDRPAVLNAFIRGEITEVFRTK